METQVELSDNGDSYVTSAVSPRRPSPRAADEMEKKLSSATRKIVCLTCITCIACLITVISCAATTWMFFQFKAFQDQQQISVTEAGSQGSGFDAIYGEDATSHESESESSMSKSGQDKTRGRHNRDLPSTTVNPKPGKKKSRKNKKNRQSRKKGQGKKRQKKCPKRCQTTTQSPTPFVPTTMIPGGDMLYVAAAHYTTYLTREKVLEIFGPITSDPSLCKYMDSWRGTACRNRTFISTEESLTLNVFQEAKWMNESVFKNTLFDKDEATGVFTATKSGIYLLYAHVLFYDIKTKQAIAIFHESKDDGTPRKRKNALRCMESMDYINPDLPVAQNRRYKSCSVTGVLYIEKGERVLVKNLYKNTMIDLTEDATYFGGMLFASRDSDRS